MILVPEQERRFALLDIPYLDIGPSELLEYMIALKRTLCPNWTDESASDIGMQILHLFSTLSSFLVAHMERIKNNCYIGTATDRESIRRLCELIGYGLSEAQAATVIVELTHLENHDPFTIPAGTQFSTEKSNDVESIMFETIESYNVAQDAQTSNILCHQGTTIFEEVIGSSNGTSDQAFQIDNVGIIWQSEIVEVNDGSWTEWTLVNNFVDSSGNDKHYRLEIRDDTDYYIVFGDGVHGTIPTAGANNIRTTYRIGLGALGNVGADMITQIVSTIQDTTSVTNPLPSSSGTDRETLENARIYGPASIKTMDRAVTVLDVEYLAKNYVSEIYGEVSVAKAFVIGGVALSVAIVPRHGGYALSGHKSELQTYLEERKVMGSSLSVIDSNYLVINISANVTVISGYAPSVVGSRITSALVEYISPVYQNMQTGEYPHGFGRNIRLSDLYAIMDNTPGVDYLAITIPESDIIIEDYRIADVGAISLTITLPDGGEYSHYIPEELRDKLYRQRTAT